MSRFDGFVMHAMNTLVTIFAFLSGTGALAVALMYFADVFTQTADAIRRNYPVIGRIQSLFAELGELFRQYFFAMAHVREVSNKSTVIKCVSGACGWIEPLGEKISRRRIEHAPDFTSIDSGDCGSGAASMPLIVNVGLTIRQTLPMVVDTLTRYGLRNRIEGHAPGKLITSPRLQGPIAPVRTSSSPPEGSCSRSAASGR